MKHKKYPKFEDYDFSDCREITGDELYRINGGGRIQPEENQNPPDEGSSSSADNYTVQSGDTLSQIVYDYNQANGTHLTVDEVAALSGIDNPDLILPGQSIVFSNPEQGGETEQPVDPVAQGGQNPQISNPENHTSQGYPSSTAGYGNLGDAVRVPYMDVVNESKETIFFDPHNESRIFCEIDGKDIRKDIKTLHKIEGMLSGQENTLWATVRNRRTGITVNFYSSQEVSAYIPEAKDKYIYEMTNAPKTGGKWISRTVTAGGEKVQLIYFREDIENDYQAKKALKDGSAYVLEEGQVINGYTFYSNNGDAYLLDLNGNRVTTTKPLQGKNVDIFPGSSTKSGVNPDTLYKNYMGTCYTGPHNPKSYQIDESEPKSNYDYLPRNLSEFASMIHDIRYEEKEASGVKGALFNTKVLYADFELVRNNYYNFNVTSDIKDKTRSLGTMAAFELIGGGKSCYKFCNDFYNSCNDLYNDFCNDYYNAGSNWKNYSKRTVNKFFQKVNNLFN